MFKQSRFAAATPLLVETPLDLRIEGTRVRGRIDAIFELEPGAWEIVDYKSGRSHNDPATLVQLQAYAVAAAAGAVAGGAPDAMWVTFAYLGSDPVEEVRHAVTDEWLETASQRISELAQAARGDDFLPTPSPQCGRCDFLSFCEAGTAWLAEQSERPGAVRDGS
jgi:RecB family exonuclease